METESTIIPDNQTPPEYLTSTKQMDAAELALEMRLAFGQNINFRVLQPGEFYVKKGQLREVKPDKFGLTLLFKATTQLLEFFKARDAMYKEKSITS